MRPRPPKDLWLTSAQGWSWPSGHSATAVLVFALFAIALTHVFHSRLARIATWIPAIVVIAAVGFSRIELGVHWTTDVLASIVFVSSWLVVTLALFAHQLRVCQGQLRHHDALRRSPVRSAVRDSGPGREVRCLGWSNPFERFPRHRRWSLPGEHLFWMARMAR
jgi:hypothetical protein